MVVGSACLLNLVEALFGCIKYVIRKPSLVPRPNPVFQCCTVFQHATLKKRVGPGDEAKRNPRAVIHLSAD